MHHFKPLILALAAWVSACGAPSRAPARSEPAPVAAAAAPGGIERPGATLDFAITAQDATSLSVRLDYAPAPEQARARVMELKLRHSAALAFASSQALAAATGAGKDVVVQERPGGVLRVVVLGARSAAPIEAGPLVELRFRRSATGPAQIELLRELPVFAPAAAEVGLVLPEPLVVALAQKETR